MNYMTILGLALALGAIMSGAMLEGLPLATLVQPTAFLIVVGGTLGAVVAQSSARTFGEAVRLLGWLFCPPVNDRARLIPQFAAWAKIAKSKGLIHLEQATADVTDPLLRKGLNMVVDLYSGELVRESLRREVKLRRNSRLAAARVWSSAAGYAPVIGIMGTVLSLFQVMQGLDGGVAGVGSGIAEAFVATIYGLGLANFLFLPAAKRLEKTIAEVALREEMCVEGFTMLAENRLDRDIQQTLDSFDDVSSNVVALRAA